MAPLVEAFPPWRLESRLNVTADGKARKPPIRNLRECALKEMLQYECDLKGPQGNPASVVVCAPVVRLFRRCADGLLVETTAWEGVFDHKSEGEVKSGEAK